MPSSVVSVINYKGGVGKTTLTANLGADLAARGRRVLLIDLDPQASLTFSFFRVPEWETQLAVRRTARPARLASRAHRGRPRPGRRFGRGAVPAVESQVPSGPPLARRCAERRRV